MKIQPPFSQTLFLWAATVFCSCTQIIPPSYSVALPALPDTWKAVLGEPSWRIEYVNDKGEKEQINDCRADTALITVMQEWTTPILAYPYWPNRALPPGTMKPAGALFPFDVEDGRILISWEHGIDATLYYELASRAGSENNKAFSRLPMYFNWIAFRELLDGDRLKEVKADPWQVDWQALAARFVKSGFDRRAIVPQARQKMTFPVPAGTWLETSPFAPTLEYKDKTLTAFISKGVNTFVSSAALLRCSEEAWILIINEE